MLVETTEGTERYLCFLEFLRCPKGQEEHWKSANTVKKTKLIHCSFKKCIIFRGFYPVGFQAFIAL